MKIKTSNKSKKILIFSLVAILMTIILLIPLFTTKPKSKDTTAEIQEQTITFSIDNEDFTANREMTWEQWVESEYNTEDYYIDEYNFICNENGKLKRNSNNVLKNYFIIDNAEYEIINTYVVNIEYEGNVLSFTFEENMTWFDWYESVYSNNSILHTNHIDSSDNAYTIKVVINSQRIYYKLVDFTLNMRALKTALINNNHTYKLLFGIDFSIDGNYYNTYNSFTWSQFVATRVGFNDFTIDNDNYITDGTNFVSYNGTNVLSTDLIVANREYDLINPIPEPELIGFTTQYSGSENQQLFDAESDMTWADWINSEYNTINLVINDNQILTNDGTYRLEIMITNENNFTYPRPVYATDTIIANTNYYLRPFGGGGN